MKKTKSPIALWDREAVGEGQGNRISGSGPTRLSPEGRNLEPLEDPFQHSIAKQNYKTIPNSKALA